jgi:K+-sensing histidine kinase KdpD
MRIGRLWRIDMAARLDSLFQKTAVRYLLAVATVASTFAVRIWLIPYTGTGAPFVLFFGAVLVASLFGGVGPGVCALVLSLPLAVRCKRPFRRCSSQLTGPSSSI